LHPNGYTYNQRVFDELLCNGLPSILGLYYSWDFADDESNQRKKRACLGLGDFATYNHMLLLVLPPLSSMTVKICIVIGHIIIVQISQEATHQLGCLYEQWTRPGVPLPVAAISMYFVVLNTFIEY
jgi:hypothetical protein